MSADIVNCPECGRPRMDLGYPCDCTPPLWPLAVLAAKVNDIINRAPDYLTDELREVHAHLFRHALPHRTEEDHAMIAVARDRGDVILEDGSTVKLVAWRYTGHRNRARIEYRSGRTGTVPCSAVVGVADRAVRTEP